MPIGKDCIFTVKTTDPNTGEERDRTLNLEEFKDYLAKGGLEQLGIDKLKLPKPDLSDRGQTNWKEQNREELKDRINNASGAGERSTERRESTTGRKSLPNPLLVELAKKLLGNVPFVKRFKDALGKFSHKGTIGLHPDLFLPGNEELLGNVLAHEIGHADDWLGDTIDTNNIGAKISAVKGWLKKFLPFAPGAAGELTPDDMTRLRKLAKQLSKGATVEREIDEEIVKEIGITPQDVIDIWNTVDAGAKHPKLTEFIKKLSDAEKKSIVKEVMKGKLPKILEQFKEIIREKTGRKITVKETIKGDYKVELNKLIAEEVAKRKLWQESELKQELYDFSRNVWRPYDESQASAADVKYRKDPAEIYADAISAFLVSPGTLEEHAPKFYEAFNNYIKEHKELAQHVEDLAKFVTPDPTDLNKHLLANIQAGYEEARRLRREANAKAEGEKGVGAYFRKLITDLKRQVLSKNFGLFDKLKGDLFTDTGSLSDKAKIMNVIEAMTNVRAVQNNVIHRLYTERYERLERNPELAKAFGTILQLEAEMNQRSDIANPGAVNAKSAEEQRDLLLSQLSPENAKLVQDELKGFHDDVYAIMESAKTLFTPEQWDIIEKNKNTYATFTPVKYAVKTLSGGIRQAEGTLDDIADPFEQTVLKMAAVVGWKTRNDAALGMRDGLQLLGAPEDIEEATPKYGPGGVVHFDEKEGYKLITYTENGKTKGFYVEPEVAKAMDRVGGETIRVFSDFNRVFRPMVTSLNLGFAIWNNPIRDKRRTVNNIVTIVTSSKRGGYASTMINYLKNDILSFKEAFRHAQGKLSPLLVEMHENNAIYKHAFGNYETHFAGEDAQLREQLGINAEEPSGIYKNKIVRLLASLASASEISTKIGAYKTFKHYGFTPEASGMYTRKYTGTPDFVDKGTLTPITNTLFPFSNVILQGLRSDLTLATNKKTAGMYWLNQAVNMLPSITMRLAMIGYFGKKLQDAYTSIDAYTKSNYLVIPVWHKDEKGNQPYVRIPMDEFSRLGHTTIISAPDKHFSDIFNIGAGLTPSLSPLFDITRGAIQYGTTGNVYDQFYGKEIFNHSEEVLNKDDRTEGAKKFLIWTGKKAGLWMVKFLEYDKRDDTWTEYAINNLPGINAIIKSTNRGDTERAEELAERSNVRNAQITQAINASVETHVIDLAGGEYNEDVKDKVVDATLNDLTKVSIERDIPKKYQDAVTKLLSDDTPPREKTETLEYLKSTLGESEFKDLKQSIDDIQDLVDSKASTVETITKVNMLYGIKTPFSGTLKAMKHLSIDARQDVLADYKEHHTEQEYRDFLDALDKCDIEVENP